MCIMYNKNRYHDPTEEIIKETKDFLNNAIQNGWNPPRYRLSSYRIAVIYSDIKSYVDKDFNSLGARLTFYKEFYLEQGSDDRF